MITLLNIETIKTNVIQRYEQIIHHRFLGQFIIPPKIDEDRLSLLLMVLLNQNIEEKMIEDYSVSATLIQSALDIHEDMSNEPLEDHPHKVRQLTVLAGDFYSGLYYYLLSKIPNIPLISKLAEGIKIVNENKMSVYKKEYRTFDQYIESIRLIETSIMQKICEYFNAPLWSAFITHYLFLKKIIHYSEMDRNLLENAENYQMLDFQIKNSYEQLLSLKMQLSNIHSSLANDLERFLDKIHLNESFIIKKG